MRRHVPALGAVVSILAIALTSPASAQPQLLPDPDVTWTVQPAFGQAGAGRDNVSGATCIGAVTARNVCLVVNDSVRFAQYFTVLGSTIRPGPLVGITGPVPGGTIPSAFNMEGAAHDDRFLYVATSKGRAGSAGQVDPDFLIARFPPDTTNPPPVPPGTVPGLQVSDRIRTALTAGIPVPGVANQQIDRTNGELQGIAITPGASVRGEGVLNLGFRNPVIGGKAFIVSAPVSAVFATSGTLTPIVTPVALGLEVGIRDLAAVNDGILILAASNRALQQRHALFLLQNDGQLKHVADIVEPTDRKAEALLVLREDPEFFIVLLMFDGVTNGGPLQYFVPR